MLEAFDVTLANPTEDVQKFRIQNSSSLKILLKIFNRCKNQNVTFDLKFFVKSWRNKAAQASFLKAIIDLEIKEPGTFKFSDLEKIQIDSTYSV